VLGGSAVKRDEKLILEAARDTLTEWLDGQYFTGFETRDGRDDEDWQLKLVSADGPLVFIERYHDRQYKIEMRVTRIER